jgi:thiol-disulfide isomerase/thioredoxin
MMTRTRRLSVPSTIIALALVGSCARTEGPLTGRWAGIVEANKTEVPFEFEIVEESDAIRASFFDGDLRVTSTGGQRNGDEVRLAFAQYGADLVGTVRNGQLEGVYNRGMRAPYPIRATRMSAGTATSPVAGVPNIAGEWTIPHDSAKGEKAWRLLVRQNSADVSAAILRVDGDTGTLTGRYRDGQFLLSHFSGARPLRLEVTPARDGTLTLLMNKQTELTAHRVEGELSKALPAPTDPAAHTRIKDPEARFAFQFPDLTGRQVSQDDFRGKVLVVNITGSWCPNCHDEAPFLVELDRTYRDRGLAVVALAFEEEDQLAAPVRLRAFMRNFGITYPVLLAGLPEQLADKVPQAENLNAFPTTLFVARDGRIRSIHAGFASPASGAFFAKGKDEIVAVVERLVAEPPPQT